MHVLHPAQHVFDPNTFVLVFLYLFDGIRKFYYWPFLEYVYLIDTFCPEYEE